MNSIAVYAGSFDPPTWAHLDIARRVQPLFKTVHVVVAANSKKQSLFSVDERVQLIRESLKEFMPKGSFEVVEHGGLITKYCDEVGAKILIRGLRAVSDFEGELAMATMNRRLNSKVETLHVMTDEKYFFLSSSLVKEVALHGGSLEGLVPETVEKALRKKLGVKRR